MIDKDTSVFLGKLGVGFSATYFLDKETLAKLREKQLKSFKLWESYKRLETLEVKVSKKHLEDLKHNAKCRGQNVEEYIEFLISLDTLDIEKEKVKDSFSRL